MAKTDVWPVTWRVGPTSTYPSARRGREFLAQVITVGYDAIAAEPDVGGHLHSALRRHGEDTELTGRRRRGLLQRAAQEHLDIELLQLASELGPQLGHERAAEHLAPRVEQGDRLFRPDSPYLSSKLDTNRSGTEQEHPVRLREGAVGGADLLEGVLG